jgi:TRAP-type C4-dicarboxylate transport system permease small subunit
MKVESNNQKSKRKIKNLLAICFALLMVISLLVWIFGLLTAVTLPWFGEIKADKIGQIGFSVALAAECCVWIFAWLWKFVEK